MKNPPKTFALVDCNNFYVSCERLFRPELNGRPVVVLSNNDGCVIARSEEAKLLGFRMGEPYFKARQRLKEHNVKVFSSNYALYGDISQRVMDTLQQLEPEVEIYSIDEAFLGLPGKNPAGRLSCCRTLRGTIKKHTGIPVSIGLGPTKTLAKIANRIAKKNPEFDGIVDITNHADIDSLLESIEVQDVWGIGRRLSRWLTDRGIRTAKALKYSDEHWIRQHLTVTGARTVLELRGTPCIPVEEAPAPKKSITCSRSFSRGLTSLVDLREAVATYTAIAVEKLRKHQLVAGSIHIFLSTNRFRSDLPQHAESECVSLNVPSACTAELLRHALTILDRTFRPGYEYQKAGVILTDLMPHSRRQQHLFAESRAQGKSSSLMAALDLVNARWGRNTLQYAAAGLQKPWSHRQEKKSPAYTTNWQELPVAKASLPAFSGDL